MTSRTNATAVHQCPKCGATQVRRTHRVTKLDRILSAINSYPFYCQDCDARFHKFGRQ